MSVHGSTTKISCYLSALVVVMLVILPASAGTTESHKTRKADLDAQSAELKQEATVARDISLNALSNVIATFNDTEKSIIIKLQGNNTSSDVKAMVNSLDEAWKSEKDVLRQIAKISMYVTAATSALNNAKIELESMSAGSVSKAHFKKADKETAIAQKNVKKATAIAEKLKQSWLLPIEEKSSDKK